MLNNPNWRAPNPENVKRLKAKLPVDRVVMWPLYFKKHWILAVIDRRLQRFDVYDSCRTYAVAFRTHCLAGVSRVLRSAWLVNMQPTMKHSDQQEPASNDCGLFTIRNLMIHTKQALEEQLTREEADGITREWLVKCWEQRLTETLPPLIKPQRKPKPAAKKKGTQKASKKSVKRSCKREYTPGH